jgi:branched-subunit amino acid permease
MQISHLTTDEAKEQYIEIINSLEKNNTVNEKSIYFNIVLLLLSFVVSCNNKKLTEVVGSYQLPKKK